jgi:alpha-ketoglutarate-dependent 2,4-dichlorophenoxyacetate dioxygenase
MDRYGVLVFRDQPFTDETQLAFAMRFDGELHAKTGISQLTKSRLGNEALTDISNLDENGEVMDSADRRRQYSLGNRLWHTDASFQDPPGRYSMLHARVVPPVAADTEFADMYRAYETLPEDTKASLEGLKVHHSIAYSRQTLGFEFSDKESDALKGAIHPLVRTNPATGRKSLYIASHASTIIGWSTPDARLFLMDLKEHATQRENCYRHAWRTGDLVIWDNRATMHRGIAYEDTKYKRELRRVTTLDLPRPVSVMTTAQGSALTR